jgi:hypothetical protein
MAEKKGEPLSKGIKRYRIQIAAGDHMGRFARGCLCQKR